MTRGPCPIMKNETLINARGWASVKFAPPTRRETGRSCSLPVFGGLPAILTTRVGRTSGQTGGLIGYLLVTSSSLFGIQQMFS